MAHLLDSPEVLSPAPGTSLFDDNSIVAFGPRVDDYVVAGYGTVDGRRVFFYEERPSAGKSDAAQAAGKVCSLLDAARDAGAPVVSFRAPPLDHSVASLAGQGEILDRQVACSGVIPQLSCVTGTWTGPAALGVALSDVVVAADESALMALTSPAAAALITGEEVTHEDIGSALTHASRTGVADLLVSTPSDGVDMVRYLLSFLPSNNLESPPYFPPTDDPRRNCDRLDALLPDSRNVPYDVKDVIGDIVDDGECLELKQHWGKSLVTALARLNGYAIGVVASQPAVLAGTLDIESSVKGARFVRFCDVFNIPLLVFVDVPGFLPGIELEYRGIIRHGAKLVYAFAEATVPRVTLIARKAYGGAYIVMNSRHLRADLSFAWPTAEIAVMGAEGAARVIHRKAIAGAEDPIEQQRVLVEDYRARFSNPYLAAERGYVDDVIEPADTRRRLIASFEMLRTKREAMPARKHGNIPL